jgi:hypothetical protein
VRKVAVETPSEGRLDLFEPKKNYISTVPEAVPQTFVALVR